MKREYRVAFHKDGQTTYSEWEDNRDAVEREVALMLVNQVVSWLENRVEPDQIATT